MLCRGADDSLSRGACNNGPCSCRTLVPSGVLGPHCRYATARPHCVTEQRYGEVENNKFNFNCNTGMLFNFTCYTVQVCLAHFGQLTPVQYLPFVWSLLNKWLTNHWLISVRLWLQRHFIAHYLCVHLDKMTELYFIQTIMKSPYMHCTIYLVNF